MQRVKKEKFSLQKIYRDGKERDMRNGRESGKKGRREGLEEEERERVEVRGKGEDLG